MTVSVETNSAELFTSKTAAPKSIAIIGGGIAALSVADHIFQQQANSQVTIFCADSELASRGSGNKQGAIYPLLQGSHSVIAEFYATSADHAMAYYRQKLATGLSVEHGFTGVLQQAIKPELEPRLEKVAQTWPEQAEYLSAQAASKIANIELPYPGLFFANAGWIWPQQFCQQLAVQLQQQFALKVELNTKVEQLVASQNWQLQYNNKLNSDQFDAIVICTGHLSAQFAQSAHIPLQSVRGQVSRLHSNTPLSELKTVLCHKGYVTPVQGQYQCFGATFIKDDNDESLRSDEQQANLAQLQRVYQQQTWASAIELSDIIADKAAIRAMSPDHLPIVGELFSNDWINANVDKNTGKLIRLKSPPGDTAQHHPDSDLSGLYIFTGLGARGLTSAPILAEQLVSEMFNQAPVLNQRMRKAVSSKRFQIRQHKQQKGLR